MDSELLGGALPGCQLGPLLAGGGRAIVLALLVLLSEDLSSPKRLLALRRCGCLLSSYSGSHSAVGLASRYRSIGDYRASLWHTRMALILRRLWLEVRSGGVVEQAHWPDARLC